MANKGIKGITIEIGGETTGLQKALQDVNKKSRDLQSELKQVDRLLKFDPGNAELIAQKQQLLGEQVQNTTEKLNRLKEAQSQVERQFKSGEIGAEQYRAFQREIASTEGKLKGLREQISKIDDDSAVQDVKNDMSKLSKGTDEAKSSVKELGGELTGLVAGLAAGGGIAGAVNQALDTSTLNTKIDITFDVPEESKSSVKEAINGVTAYGVDAEEALEGVRRQWALNKDASDESNAAVIEGAGAIAAAYSGVDFTELIQETNEISKTLGITNEEALGLTNSLLALGFPPEQVDIIAEYGQQLSDAGYNAEEIQAIMAAGVETGTWNIDNLLDGVKEGRIRLAEFGNEVPKAMEDLLSKTDISAKQMQEWGKAVAEGGDGGKKAMEEMALALQGVEDDTTRNALGAQVFGTMWEDQGTNIIDTLVNMDDHMMTAKENQDALNGSVEKLNADPAVKMQKAIGDLKIALEPVLEVIANVITKIAEWASNNPTLTATIVAITTVIGILIGIAMALIPIFVAISTAATAAGVSIGAILAPIGIAIAAIAAIIAIGVLLYKNWDTIKAKAIEIWGSLKTWFSSFWEHTKTTFSNAMSAIGKFVSDGFNKAKSTTQNVWNAIKSFFSSTWNSIKSTFNSVINTIVNFVVSRFNNLKSNVSNIFNAVRSTISTVWNNIRSLVSSVLSSIVSAVSSRFNSLVSTVRGTMNNVLSTIRSIWNSVMSFFRGINLASIGRNIIQGLINGVKGMASKLISSVKGVVDNAIDAAKNLLGINSPSRVFMEIGEFTGEGFALGMDSMTKAVAKAGQSMADASIPELPKLPKKSSIVTPNQSVNIQPAPVYLDNYLIGEIIFPQMDNQLSNNAQMSLYMKGARV